MTTFKHDKIVVSGSAAQTLAWHGGRLIDPVGGKEYKVDGSLQGLSIGHIKLGDGRVYPLGFSVGFTFDAVMCESISGSDWMVCFQKFGTKGIVLKDYKFVREINRSFEFADRFEFPVGFIKLPDGRAGLVHCPENAYRLVVEDAETGVTVALCSGGQNNFYHSRLSVSPDLERFIDHGWLWHPVQFAELWMMVPNLDEGDPKVRFSCHELDYHPSNDEFENATFDAFGNIVTCQWAGDADDLSQLAIWDPSGKKRIREMLEVSPTGIVYCGTASAYCLFDHLRVIDLETGVTLQSWPEVRTGKQRGIISSADETPVHAFDQRTFSIAVAVGEQVHIIRSLPDRAVK